MFCRCFYNIDKWTLSGRPVYLLLAAAHILVTIGVLGALAYALAVQARIDAGGRTAPVPRRQEEAAARVRSPRPWSPC